MISSVDGNNAISQASLQVKSNTAKTTASSSKNTKGADVSSAKSTQKVSVHNVETHDSNVSNEVHSNQETNNNSEVSTSHSKNQSNTQLLGNYGKNEEIYYPESTSTIPTSLLELAAMVGSNSSNVTKDQLTSYLRSIMSSDSTSATEIAVVKNIIAQFESLSSGTPYVTSLQGLKEAQDYTTITSAQVTSPIDIRI